MASAGLPPSQLFGASMVRLAVWVTAQPSLNRSTVSVHRHDAGPSLLNPRKLVPTTLDTVRVQDPPPSDNVVKAGRDFYVAISSIFVAERPQRVEEHTIFISIPSFTGRTLTFNLCTTGEGNSNLRGNDRTKAMRTISSK